MLNGDYEAECNENVIFVYKHTWRNLWKNFQYNTRKTCASNIRRMAQNTKNVTMVYFIHKFSYRDVYKTVWFITNIRYHKEME